jgi:O-antigen/teichoic acid export membrane protein
MLLNTKEVLLTRNYFINSLSLPSDHNHKPLPIKITQAKSPFNKHVFTLVMGTSLAQMLTFAAYPLVSRLYSPDEFGVFGVFISISGMIALIATGRYELAIVLPDEEKEAKKLLNLSFIINGLVSVLALLVVLIIWVCNVSYGTAYEPLTYLLWLAPPVIFLTSASNIFQNWFIRQKKYRLLSYSKIIQALVNNSLIIALAYTTAKHFGLVAGFGLAMLLVVVYFLAQFRRFFTQKIDSKNITFKHIAQKYIAFPKANTWHALSDVFQSQGIIYFIAIFFSSGIVGLYAFAIRILQAPMMLIINSISQVFYQSAAEMHRSGQSIVPMLKSTVQKISLISIPFLLILMLFGPDLFAFFFSEKWRASGEFARILAPWLCLDFVRYGIAQLPLVLGKVRQMMYWSIFGNLMMAGSMCAGALIFDDIRTGLIILSGAMCLYLVLLISWIFKIARNGSHR